MTVRPGPPEWLSGVIVGVDDAQVGAPLRGDPGHDVTIGGELSSSVTTTVRPGRPSRAARAGFYRLTVVESQTSPYPGAAPKSPVPSRSPARRIRLAARKVKRRHLTEVIHTDSTTCADLIPEDCVADGRVSGAGTEEGSQLRTACGPLACRDLTT